VGCVILNIEIFREAQITRELDEKIRDGLCFSFPQDAGFFRKTRFWNGIIPVSAVLGFSDDESRSVIAHMGIVQRRILVNRRKELFIFGIQNVFIHPDYRGTGVLGSLMDAVSGFVRAESYDCGLLFCVPELEKVYSRFSWKKIYNSRISKVDEAGEEILISEKNIAMFYPLSLTVFPAGDINLRGYDW
jgi:GNAT superfamily N-acetyltransferase